MQLGPHRPKLGPFSALLTVSGADGHVSSIPFRHPRMVVGRKRPADLAVNDQRVSSRHCEFAAEDGLLVVRDLESINGTFVNERRIHEARLVDGDLVRIGNTRVAIAIQGGRAARLKLRERIVRSWPILVGLVACLLVVGGVALYRYEQLAAEARMRTRYAQLVRGQLQEDVCTAAQPFVDKLATFDQQLNGRAVPLPPPGHVLSPTDRQRAVDLLALYRAKVELYSLATLAATEAQQRERDNLERVTRSGARLTDSKDRKVAFWAEGQLSERVAKGEAFLSQFQLLARETGRFTSLAEAAALRNESGRAQELAAFRFPSDAKELVKTCHSEIARSTSGVLGALNAFEDD
ncbi:MAG: FHA domain-containing protein [Deltaproteobacteria bacterium]|nr:FHA domain-containing protein [Deltaproteobacteria bacterium]